MRNSADIDMVISSEEFIQVNDVQFATLSCESIVNHITATVPNFADDPVVLGGEADARHVTVVMVLDALAELGIDDESILVREPIPE